MPFHLIVDVLDAVGEGLHAGQVRQGEVLYAGVEGQAADGAAHVRIRERRTASRHFKEWARIHFWFWAISAHRFP